MPADIELRTKKGEVVLLSARDEGLLKHHWHISEQGYAVRNRACINGKHPGGPLKMHREILDTPKGMMSDHINGNRLDNRRENLRICNATENARNVPGDHGSTSRFKGVCWDKYRGKWQANIGAKPNRYRLGRFDSEEDAARAYDVAASKYHGEFAWLNFPSEGVSP